MHFFAFLGNQHINVIKVDIYIHMHTHVYAYMYIYRYVYVHIYFYLVLTMCTMGVCTYVLCLQRVLVSLWR